MYCYTSSDIVKVFNYIKCLVMLLGEHIYFDSEEYFFQKKKLKRMWVEEFLFALHGSTFCLKYCIMYSGPLVEPLKHFTPTLY